MRHAVQLEQVKMDPRLAEVIKVLPVRWCISLLLIFGTTSCCAPTRSVTPRTGPWCWIPSRAATTSTC